MKTRIVLADDHTMMRQGLRGIIEQDFGMTVVGQAADGLEAVRLAGELQPDVIVMDVSMPLMNGIDATKEICARFSGIKIVALSMHRELNFITDMFRAGAHAYILKHCVVDELERAIQSVLDGRKYLSPDLTDIVIEGYTHSNYEQGGQAQQLSARERNILQLLAEGKSTKQTADILFISVSTVETHRQHIMEKLGLHTIAELTHYAIRTGLTEL